MIQSVFVRGVALFLGVLMLVSCKTPDAGEGPLIISPRTKTAIDAYFKTPNPMFFAITEDGVGGFWYQCPNATTCINPPYDAITRCESLNNGRRCKIYAVGRNVVWDGPVSFRSDETSTQVQGSLPTIIRCRLSDGSSILTVADKCQGKIEPAEDSRQSAGASPATESRQSSTLVRSFSAKWAGYDDMIAGTMTILEGKDGGTVAFQLPRSEGACQGGFLFGPKGIGTWSAACSNGITATGTFEGLGRDKGAHGSGTDSKGRAITFTIGGEADRPSTTLSPAKVPALTGKDRSDFLFTHQINCVRQESQTPLVSQLGIPEAKIKTFCECRGEALADLLSLEDIKVMLTGAFPTSVNEKMVYQTAACSDKAGIVKMPR